MAWHRHIIGGAFGSGNAVVESVAVIPGDLDEDEVYLIRIDMEGYFGNNWTNIRVDMDTLNILNDKVLDKKPEFKGIIDSTYLPGEK